ncbi:MAG: hypothetical protein M3Q48_18015 [Actinomycetota bacterium]|nr:hypothetical protein [Actinomycetota bacterium]
MTPGVTRRQLLAAGAGAVGSAAAALLGNHVWPLLAGEDLVPGSTAGTNGPVARLGGDGLERHEEILRHASAASTKARV